MVSANPNPALEAFVAEIAPELVFGEVLVRRTPCGFELTHAADRDMATLTDATATELREISQFTAAKQFRPLKSAPSLRRGWRFVAGDATELDTAFQCLYPGAVADWFAARQRHPPITNYRDYTSRQTGMYRVTTMLSDGQVAAVGRAGCKPRFCLKQRLWTVNGLAPDESSAKSLLSCLEPCAVLLEFARSAARIEQGPKFGVSLASEEVRTLIGALEGSLAKPFLAAREADFSDLGNPRRVQLILEKLRQVLGAKDEQEHS